jgi:hypothetical protein
MNKKNLRGYFYFFSIFILFVSLNYRKVIAQDITRKTNIFNKCWLELQYNNFYDNNDFYINSYNKYFIFQSNNKIGIQAYKNKGFVIEPYLKNSITWDILEKVWNKVDWHNNMVNGIGCRMRYSLKALNFINSKVYPEDFNIDLLCEKLWIDYLKTSEFYIGHRPGDDIKVGIQYWLNLGFYKKEDFSGLYYWFLNNCWLESAGSLIYSKSNFYVKSNENFYLITFNNKIGARLRLSEKIFFEPYFHNIIITDIGKELWNQVDWNNNNKNGLGFRFSYLPFIRDAIKNKNLNVNFYFEYLQIRYYDNTVYVPNYRPDNDWLVGINIWFSLISKKIANGN